MRESRSFYLASGPARASVIAKINEALCLLPTDKPWRVTVELHKPRRTLSQNALMWAMFDQIIKKGGEDLGGWTRQDLHDFFCGEHFGWERVQIFGKPRQRAMRGTSGLNKQEFSDFIEFIVRYMSERGVTLDMPTGDDWRNA